MIWIRQRNICRTVGAYCSDSLFGESKLRFWASGSEHYNVHVVVTAKYREVVITAVLF